MRSLFPALALALPLALSLPIAPMAVRPVVAAEVSGAPSRVEPPAAEKLRRLLELAADPEVRAALEARVSTERAPGDGASAAGGDAQREPGRGGAADADAMPGDTVAGGLSGGLKRLRDHAIELAGAVPRLPGEVERARDLLTGMLGRGDPLSLALFVPLFVALGFGGEALFRFNMRRFGRWLLALPLETARERVSAVFVRLAYGLGIVVFFTLGSVGAMLPFDFSARFKQVLLALLLAAVVTRLAAVVGRFLLAPGAPRFRLVPIDTACAAFLFHRLIAAGLLLGVGSQTISLLAPFGFDADSRELVVDAFETAALALALATIAGYPRPAAPAPTSTTTPAVELSPPGEDGGGAETPDRAPTGTRIGPRTEPRAEWRRLRARWARLGLTATAALLWCFALAEADRAFWLLGFAVLGPAAVRVAQSAVRHVMRPAGPADGGGAHRIEVVLLERGLRTAMIVAAAALLAHLIGLDVANLAMHDSVSDRVTRGAIGVVVVVLVADFLWHVIVALIDRKLAGTLDAGHGMGHAAGTKGAADGGAHAARLQTLLPIARNLSLAALVAVAGTMVIASLGVEIGPLIASAGVVGVAIGFGAQTLVKDIISGIFYLVDDAFRIGEYIQSGSYKGTVESFSLRSVKLRHQRGALYTIPFGTLGAVQNLSRDWVVDKILLNVPYDTDIDAVRRIMKRIGAELMEDEELAPGIIGTLKLQGVSQFGDYAIKLQTKMTTLPGDVQFAARRRALLLIQREFKARGIGFALPIVQVSGDASEGAAAQNALSVVRAAEATAAE